MLNRYETSGGRAIVTPLPVTTYESGMGGSLLSGNRPRVTVMDERMGRTYNPNTPPTNPVPRRSLAEIQHQEALYGRSYSYNSGASSYIQSAPVVRYGDQNYEAFSIKQGARKGAIYDSPSGTWQYKTDRPVTHSSPPEYTHAQKTADLNSFFDFWTPSYPNVFQHYRADLGGQVRKRSRSEIASGYQDLVPELYNAYINYEINDAQLFYRGNSIVTANDRDNLGGRSPVSFYTNNWNNRFTSNYNGIFSFY